MTASSLFARARARLFKADRLFLAVVVAPTTAAVLYFGLIASDVYVSESHFVVRSPEKQTSIGFGAMLSGVAGFSKSLDDTHSVHDFMLSRDAMTEINRSVDLRRAYSSGDLFSRFNPLGFSGTNEDLFRHYQGVVAVELNNSSSISVLSVSAYSPEQAKAINARLLALGEDLINTLNDRGRLDLVRFAEDEVAQAEKRSTEAAAVLSEYRSRQGVIDPEQQSGIQLQQISKMQDELISVRTRLSQIEGLSPDNPQIPSLQSRIQSLQSEIKSETAKVAGTGPSLSKKAVEYQRLALEREFAAKQLASAMASLEQARNDALKKRLYLERIVQPSLPDQAIQPRRLRGILATLLTALLAYAILSMLLAGVREHKD